MSFEMARTVVVCGVGFAICASLVGAVIAASLMLLYDARVAATQLTEPTRSDAANHLLTGVGTPSRFTRLKRIARLPLDVLGKHVVTRSR